ncbi:hypothetical protein LTR93_011349 [Exophiala xenobiotica]|nr:hypothetical protein LTR93_011349 [Exophiala xenobiotica]
MDSIIFEDASNLGYALSSMLVQCRPGCTSTRTQAVETILITLESSSLQEQISEAPLYELCRSPLHDDTAGDGQILEETHLIDGFSLAQIDGLAKSPDDDSDSLFSSVSPELECFKTVGSDDHFDGQAQSYTSRVAETCDVFISLPSDYLVRSETPSLRTNSDAIDLMVESYCPQPKRTAAPSPPQCFPSFSHHEPRIEVVIPARRPSPVSQRNLTPLSQ